MGDERLGEGAAVARLQDRRLDLDEAVLVEIAPDRRHHAVRRRNPRATRRSRAGRGSAAGTGSRRPAGRGTCRATACGSSRAARASSTASEGSPRPRLESEIPNTSMRSPRSRSTLPDEQLDPSGAVDEIDEGELAHVAPRHRPPARPRSPRSSPGSSPRPPRGPMRSRPGPESVSEETSPAKTTPPDLHDLELQRTTRRRDFDGLALLVADDRLADRRLVRQLVLCRVRFRRADDVVLERLLRLDVAEFHVRAEGDDVLRDRILLLDHARGQEPLLELGDPVLEHRLLVLGVVVLRVLGDVAELPGDPDAVGHLAALIAARRGSISSSAFRTPLSSQRLPSDAAPLDVLKRGAQAPPRIGKCSPRPRFPSHAGENEISPSNKPSEGIFTNPGGFGRSRSRRGSSSPRWRASACRPSGARAAATEPGSSARRWSAAPGSTTGTSGRSATSEDRRRRAPARGADLRVGAGGDGRGCSDGRRRRSGHRGHQLRLPGPQDHGDRRRCDLARRPERAGAIVAAVASAVDRR